MSSLYNLEPQPTAKVLLQTTSGDIEIELFAKQTPITSRNFLQLCLNGYYNGTIFHRLVPGFVLQGGDPTNTGEGGESIYDGGVFADEFHSRLKFNRRGLLGMANSGRKDDNGSQFFFTLGKTEELNGMNTMFGRVMGDTVYNLMKMGEADLADGEKSERPLYPTKVTGAEILVNPFEDMIPTVVSIKPSSKEQSTHEKKKLKKRGGKTLLSFEGEEGDEEIEGPTLKKAKFNTKLVSAPESAKRSSTAIGPQSPSSRKISKTVRRRSSLAATSPPKLNLQPETQLPLRNDEKPSRSPSTSPEPPAVEKVSSLLEKTNAQIADLKASMKRHAPSATPESSRKKSALEQMIPQNAVRGRKRKQGNNANAAADARALQLLHSFRAKLDQASPEEVVPQTKLPNPAVPEAQENDFTMNGDDAEEEGEEAHLCDLHFIANCQSCKSWDKENTEDSGVDEDDDFGWMSHALSFDKDRLGKDLNWKRRNEEELVVIDPREKAKEIKEEQRAKKQDSRIGSRPQPRSIDARRG